MWDPKQKPGSSLKIGERRAQVRLQCPFLIFMNQDGSNGGLVFNITEAGMALSSAQPLLKDRFIDLRVQFLDPLEWIDLTGQIVWVSESKKEAGIEFVGLENEVLERIRNWIASETSSGEFHSEADVPFIGLPEKTLPRTKNWTSSEAVRKETPKQKQSTGISEEREEKLKITNAPERETHVPVPPAPAEETRKIEEAPLFSPTSAASETFAPSRKPHSKPIRPRRVHVQRKVSGWHSAQRAFGALLILASFPLITWEWILSRSDVRTELPGAAAPTTKAEAHKRSATSEETTTESAGTAQAEQKNLQHPQTGSLLGTRKNESLFDRSLKDPRQPLLTARASAKPIAKAASRPAKNRLEPEQEKTKSWHVATSVNAHPLENTSQTPGNAFPAPPQLEAELIQPANPRSLTTNTSQPGPPKARESLMLPAKQPTTQASYSGAAVAILADPYPALRLPDGRSSKKQRQVATLELGHLLSRVEPVYPEEAKQQGIQGTVRLHAIIDRHGAVEKVESINGPTVLVAAATNAVRHWRYTETLLAGQSVETEEDIAVIFRLSNSETPKK